jgi:hypothetical protein
MANNVGVVVVIIIIIIIIIEVKYFYQNAQSYVGNKQTFCVHLFIFGNTIHFQSSILERKCIPLAQKMRLLK